MIVFDLKIFEYLNIVFDLKVLTSEQRGAAIRSTEAQGTPGEARAQIKLRFFNLFPFMP